MEQPETEQDRIKRLMFGSNQTSKTAILTKRIPFVKGQRVDLHDEMIKLKYPPLNPSKEQQQRSKLKSSTDSNDEVIHDEDLTKPQMEIFASSKIASVRTI